MPDQLSILIAEEQVECCLLFKMFLQRCGYRVATVHDDVSCLEALRVGSVPDVLILSWELPWSGGAGVLDLMNTHGLNDMGVVVLTARMDVDTCQQETALPGVTWVQRPFGLVELMNAVKSAESVSHKSWTSLDRLGCKSQRLQTTDASLDLTANPQQPLCGGMAQNFPC